MPRSLRYGGRGFRTSRDYESERAGLLEGRNTALQFYQEQSESIMDDPSLSNEEKRAALMACRSEMERTEGEYQEALWRLNSEEAESEVDEYGVSEDDTDEYGVSEDNADEYGVAEADADEIVLADEYCASDEDEQAETNLAEAESNDLGADYTVDRAEGYE